jgi:hypothetical protein
MRKTSVPKKLQSQRKNTSSSLEKKSSLTLKLKLILIKHLKE